MRNFISLANLNECLVGIVQVIGGTLRNCSCYNLFRTTDMKQNKFINLREKQIALQFQLFDSSFEQAGENDRKAHVQYRLHII